MSLKDYFKPSGHVQSLRVNQIDALNQTEVQLTSGIRFIEIEAPPGSGKSVLVDTLMNYFNSFGMKCIVTSPQNSQVLQYADSGFGMATLMGREHYKCIAGKENCSKGFCTLKKCPDGKLTRDCQAQDYSSCFNCICGKCNYKKAFKVFRNSDKANTNFTLFLMGIDNKPQVVFIDEADTIEPSIRDFNSIVIPELFPHYRFPEIIPDLFGFIDRSVKEIEDIKTKRAAEKKEITETEEKRINYLEDLCGRILLITKDYESHKEPWCVTQKTESKKTKIEPVTIERFLKNILRNRIVFMLSATPPHYPGFERVRVESSFPIATRQWIYDPFPGSLVKSQREASIPRAAVWLSSLQGKTLVHCKSYKTAEMLHQKLRIIKRSSLLQVNKNDNSNEEHRYSRYDAVKAFLASKNPDEILISVNQGRGLNLHQPEVINNVILVVPWQNPKDPLTILKTQILGEAWKKQEVANEVAQAIARHFRNEKMGIYMGKEVPKRAFIIDASWGRWYNVNKGLFPKNFTESERL